MNSFGVGGNTCSTFSSNTALNNLAEYVDANSKLVILELLDSPCEGQLVLFYEQILPAVEDNNYSLVSKINCSIQNMEVTPGGGCDISISENYSNFSFVDLDDDLQSWILSATSAPDAVLNNPVCDMIEAGHTAEEVNAYLAFIKPALENEPDPGYNGGEPDPYSAYNIDTDEATVNKVTQFLIDYPCLESMDYLGLLLSEPEVMDWAKIYLGGNCTDATKNEYVNLVFEASVLNKEIVNDCEGNPDPVCLECGIALEKFTIKYVLELTNEEEEILNAVSCDENFDVNAWNQLAMYKHSILKSLYTEYEEANIDVNNLITVLGAPEYYKYANLYDEFKIESAGAAPEIIPVYFIKKIAEAGIGMVADIGVQLIMEYWMGDHETLLLAWEEMEINYWQVVISGAEATVKNKYASIIALAFTDATNYILTTEEEDFTWEEFNSTK